MSSISRRRTGLMAFSVIGGLLSWVRFLAPQSQDRTPASATPRDPSLATNYRGSGLVLRRNSVVAAPPGKDPFTIPLRTLLIVCCQAMVFKSTTYVPGDAAAGSRIRTFRPSRDQCLSELAEPCVETRWRAPGEFLRGGTNSSNPSPSSSESDELPEGLGSCIQVFVSV